MIILTNKNNHFHLSNQILSQNLDELPFLCFEMKKIDENKSICDGFYLNNWKDPFLSS